jgi:hypothetical protein
MPSVGAPPYSTPILQLSAERNAVATGIAPTTNYIVEGSGTLDIANGGSFWFTTISSGSIEFVHTGATPGRSLQASRRHRHDDTKQVGANTVITVDANDSVTSAGVAASHLTASNFSFNH